MRERRLVEVVQQILQFFVAGTPRREFGPIGLAQWDTSVLPCLLAISPSLSLWRLSRPGCFVIAVSLV